MRVRFVIEYDRLKLLVWLVRAACPGQQWAKGPPLPLHPATLLNHFFAPFLLLLLRDHRDHHPVHTHVHPGPFTLTGNLAVRSRHRRRNQFPLPEHAGLAARPAPPPAAAAPRSS